MVTTPSREPDPADASIADVLSGHDSYDLLSDKDQAIVRDLWEVATNARRESLNLAAEFNAAGRSYVELDEDGAVVHRGPAQ